MSGLHLIYNYFFFFFLHCVSLLPGRRWTANNSVQICVRGVQRAASSSPGLGTE